MVCYLKIIAKIFHKLRLYVKTLSFLKPVQIYYQLYYRFRKRSIGVATEGVLITSDRLNWPSFLQSSTEDGETFTFLGESGSICDGWNPSNCEKLWKYNLHYLHDISIFNENGSAPAFAEDLIWSWVKNNQSASSVGWEAYPTSLRLVNILKFYTSPASAKPSGEVLMSLISQANCLFKNLEYHILANHLFVNAKALVFCGALIQSKFSNNWLAKGLELLDSELGEQFLNDGGHFELSPMYHAALLWDMCELVALTDVLSNECLSQRKSSWIAIIQKGLLWLDAMSHPDGDISFFNDAAFKNAPKLSDIIGYCSSLNITLPVELTAKSTMVISDLKDTGFISVSSPVAGHKLLIDAGEIGPDYQPGHAHADTLSFELSLFGSRLFVNSGTSQYGISDRRDFQRGTLAHNTVTVDEKNSSEVWAGFRVANRAKLLSRNILIDADMVSVFASHDGYRRLKGKVDTARSWNIYEHSIVITDELWGTYNAAVVRFFLHPSIKIIDFNHNKINMLLPTMDSVSFSMVGHVSYELLTTEWYSEFGVAEPNQCIEVKLGSEKNKLVSVIKW